VIVVVEHHRFRLMLRARLSLYLLIKHQVFQLHKLIFEVSIFEDIRLLVLLKLVIELESTLCRAARLKCFLKSVDEFLAWLLV